MLIHKIFFRGRGWRCSTLFLINFFKGTLMSLKFYGRLWFRIGIWDFIVWDLIRVFFSLDKIETLFHHVGKDVEVIINLALFEILSENKHSIVTYMMDDLDGKCFFKIFATLFLLSVFLFIVNRALKFPSATSSSTLLFFIIFVWEFALVCAKHIFFIFFWFFLHLEEGHIIEYGIYNWFELMILVFLIWFSIGRVSFHIVVWVSIWYTLLVILLLRKFNHQK